MIEQVDKGESPVRESDIDSWCELLAGREDLSADERLRLEVGLVRKALELRRQSLDDIEVTSDDVDLGLRKLIAYGEASGAFAVAPQPARKVSWTSRVSQIIGDVLRPRGIFGPLAAFASVLVVLAVVVRVVPQAEPPAIELERGASRAGTPIEVADPAAAAAALATDLSKLGVKPSLRQDGQFWFVEAVLPRSGDERIVKLLGRYGLTEPPDGGLEVVFARKP